MKTNDIDFYKELKKRSADFADFLACIIHRASSASDFASVLLKNRSSTLYQCRIKERLCEFSANFLHFQTPDMGHTKHTGMTSRALITRT